MYIGSYASILNQAFHLAHYLLAFSLAFFFIPQLMFKPVEGTKMDNYFANFLRMTLFVIVLGYLLIVTKLLEFIGFSAAIVTWILLTRGKERTLNASFAIVVALFYDLIETPYLIRQGFKRLTRFVKRGRRREAKTVRKFNWRRFSIAKLIYLFLFLSVLAVTVYLRWTDPIVNAPPPMSDGHVILAWVKYVNLRFLFHDGIYPQGYFIADDFISKFAFIDPLYVVKYTGAMATTLIVAGLYYVTSRMGRTSEAAGIIAAALYGVFGYALLHVEWVRQAGVETQEFGFIFALPTLYFAYRYFRDGVRRDLTTTFAGLTASGLIHVISYLITVVGCISVLLAFLVFDGKKNWLRYGAASVAGVASGLISLAPDELGKLFHHAVNSGAASFASATLPSSTTSTGGTASHLILPVLHPMSKVAVLCILFILVASIVARIRGRRETAWLTAGIFGALMFLIFYLGGPITRSAVIASRAIDIWAIAAAFVIGYAVHILTDLVTIPWVQVTERIALMGIVFVPQILSPPQPIIPYKMQWNTDVEEYLRIDSQYKNAGYMIVSPNEEYALVLGSGYHMAIPDFLKLYNPKLRPLTRYGQINPDTNIAPNVFIYYHKNVFEVPKSDSIYYTLESSYKQEAKNRDNLAKWLQTYRQAHQGLLHVYYNGPNLTIYYIHNGVTDSASPALPK